jgi:hypothetical protein
MPTPSSPTDPALEPESHSPLSPFTILAKKEGQDSVTSASSLPETPAVAAPVADPPINTIDRDELIKQAATAPTHTFILPQSPAVAADVLPTVSAPAFRVTPAVSKPISPPPPPAPPVPQPPVYRPVIPQPPAPAPVAVPSPALRQSVQMDMGGMTTSPAPARAKRSSHFAAAIGVLIGIAILGAAAYGLALSGMRIPLLYPHVSGISGNGQTVGKNAASFLASTSGYLLLGSSTLKRTSQTGNAKPGLPDPSVATDPTASFIGLKSDVAVPDQMFYDIKEAAYSGKLRIAQDGAAGVPILFHETHGDKGTVAFKLPASANALLSVSSDDLRDTLLYPAIRLIPLPVFLSSIQAEQNYRKVLVNGKESARYTYALNKSALQDSVPRGATIANPVADITYSWHNGQPSIVDFVGTITYLGRNYQLTQHQEFGNFGSALSSVSAEIRQMASADIVGSAVTSSMGDFVGQLGVVSYAGLPHGGGTTAVTPNATPAPSSSPVASPSPTPSAIVPSGLSVSSAQPSITQVPPIPKATGAGTTRDIQRKKDLADLQTALESYKLKQGSYPVSAGIEQVQSSTLLFKALVPAYVTKMPIDPLKDTYWYEYSSDGSTFTLHSVAEIASDTAAQKGIAFSYFEFQNK